MKKLSGFQAINSYYTPKYRKNWQKIFSVIVWIMISDKYIITNNSIINDEIKAEFHKGNIMIRYILLFHEPLIDIIIGV
jgi:hypothetical protein